MSGIAAPTRPALRYHGGKWLLAPWIISHFPRHRTYLEAYGGGASVLLRKPRCRGEIYNDIDGDIVNVFRVLQNPAQASRLRELLALTPFARDEWRLAYEPADDPVEQARRVMIRSQMGFGSDSCNANRGTGFRKNANRRATTPAVDWSRFPDCVPTFTARFAGVVIENKPALEVMPEHDREDTLHYLDPTYLLSVCTAGGRGYAHIMSDADHKALAPVARGLKGAVILSHYRCEMYDEFYGDWKRVDRRVLVFRQTHRIESLYLNPRAARAIHPTLF
jgi:DNA adenine methylase